MKQRGGTHQIATGLEDNTAGGLRVLQLLDRGKMAVDEDGIGERPQMFRRLKFGRVRWQEQQVDVVWHTQTLGTVPARTVQHQYDLLLGVGPCLARESC